MIMIEIREVNTKKQLKAFVQFPVRLYKDNPYYVPSLQLDEMEAFDPKKNPAYEFCEAIPFLAYQNGKIVGRIAGLISHAYNKKVDKNLARFTRYDVIDDVEVSKALFEKVITWAKSKGMNSLMGPIGFTDLDKQGMLVEGFEEMDLSLTLYNYPYYMNHMEELGFLKDADWVEYQIDVPTEMDPRIGRVSSLVKKRYGFHRVEITDRKTLLPYAKEAFRILNKAYAKLYGFVPMTEAVTNKAIKEYVPLVNLDYVIIIADKNDQIIGFGLAVPSIAAALKKSNGKLFPFGLFRMLKALKKHDILEMYLIAVLPDYQNLGVNAIIMAESIEAGIRNKARIAETGPELELNQQIQDQWKGFSVRQHRRRRCYIKEI